MKLLFENWRQYLSDDPAEEVIDALVEMSDEYNTAEEIAGTNYATAIDQKEDYDSVEDAVYSYWINAADTARENGISHEDIWTAYYSLMERDGIFF